MSTRIDGQPLRPYANPRDGQVEDGKPDQFCAPMEGIKGGTPLFVGAYPVAWRIEIFDDDKHRGFEYVR